MAKSNILKTELGFTLIELILVMAISGSLLMIAFVGQRALRSRAQFDAAVDKVVSSVSSARTQATAGVNTLGAGKGLVAGKCPLGPNPNPPTAPVVFAGTAWIVDNRTGSDAAFEIDYYKAIPGLPGTPPPPTAACVFDSQVIPLPTGVQVSAPVASVGRVTGMLFVRSNTGALQVCPAGPNPNKVSFGNAARVSFENATCLNAAMTLTFKDLDGHTSDIRIDSSGLAQRLN